MSKGRDYERPVSNYSGDNQRRSSSSSARGANDAYLQAMAGRTSQQSASRSAVKTYKLDPLLDPKKVAVTGSQKFDAGGRPIPDSMKFKDTPRAYECRDFTDAEGGGEKVSTPIVVAFDVTQSRGEDVQPVFDKLPMLIGQLSQKGYAEYPAISFCAVGDATVDQVPIQAGYFETDTRLDEVLAKIYSCMERGGGGTGQESYELAALLYAERTKLDSLDKRGQKGFFFFVGDEGFYPKVSAKQAKDHLGINLPEDLDTAEVFRRLQTQYEVFFIYPASSWEDRKADIDKEIEKRVKAAGGMYDDVDIRCSLLWNTLTDLDLHCAGPDGHIYYGDKKRGDGWLDVDANVHGDNPKPVENIRWPRGRAKPGNYRLWVNNYTNRNATNEFRVELEVNGKVEQIDGVSTKVGEDIRAFEFVYDPAERHEFDPNKKYAGYDDKVIKAQWASVLPEDHILLINDPRRIADIIIGVLALHNGTSLDDYDKDMAGRDQTEAQRADVGNALKALSNSFASVEVEGDLDDL